MRCGLKVPVGEVGTVVWALSPESARRYGLTGWSLTNLQCRQDATNNSLLAKGLCNVLRKMRVQKIFAPNVTQMNARIIDSTQLKINIPLGKNIILHRNHRILADGIFLEPGEAFAMSSSGCPIILAVAGKKMIAAHAGRDSLVDRDAVMGRTTQRHVSVVDTIIDEFLKRRFSRGEISMCMLFAIPPRMFEHRLDHPQYGEYNQKFWEFANKRWPDGVIQQNSSVFPDLELIFISQAKQAGVCHVWASYSLSELPHLAHTHDNRDSKRRNLIVVKRCF